MSNISRRKFLKGAGVAALAVAAAGVLAGCSKDDIVIPGVTAKDVTVIFVDRKGNEVGTTVVKNVPLTETKMNTGSVEPPKGYVYGIVGDEFIDWEKQTVTFTVDKKEVQKVQISYYNREGDGEVGTEILELDKDAIKFNTSELKKIPDGYKLDTMGDIMINEFKLCTIYVSRK